MFKVSSLAFYSWRKNKRNLSSWTWKFNLKIERRFVIAEITLKWINLTFKKEWGGRKAINWIEKERSDIIIRKRELKIYLIYSKKEEWGYWEAKKRYPWKNKADPGKIWRTNQIAWIKMPFGY